MLRCCAVQRHKARHVHRQAARMRIRICTWRGAALAPSLARGISGMCPTTCTTMKQDWSCTVPETDHTSRHMSHLFGVLRARIEHVELRLQAAHHKLVHLNVPPVVLHAAHAVLHVGLPPHLQRANAKGKPLTRKASAQDEKPVRKRSERTSRCCSATRGSAVCSP